MPRLRPRAVSPRKTGPDLFVAIDPGHGVALVRGPRAREVLERAAIPYRVSRRTAQLKGWVIPAGKVPDLESWCQWQGLLCIVSGRPKVERVAPEPVFVAPEPEPEPPPPLHEQDGLFG